MKINDEREKLLLYRVNYHYNFEEEQTKNIFNTITEVLYDEFLSNPSFVSLRMLLEDIINGNLEKLSRYNQIKINLLFNKYNISKGFNNKLYYMYDLNSQVKYTDNKIINAINNMMLMKNSNIKYHELIMYYLIFIFLKCKENISYSYAIDKLNEDLELEIENIIKFVKIFTMDDELKKYCDNKPLDVYKSIEEYKLINNDELRYKEKLESLVSDIMDDNFTKSGKIRYVDNSSSSIRIVLPSSENILIKNLEDIKKL